MTASHAAESPATVLVAAADLMDHGTVFCPNPAMALWAAHPRVFLDVATTGDAKCPYCGTLYRLRAGDHVAPH